MLENSERLTRVWGHTRPYSVCADPGLPISFVLRQLDIQHLRATLFGMKPILLALVLSIAGFNASSSFAQPATAPAPTQGTQASDVAKKPRAIPFHGNLTAVNAAANTLTVGKRVFTINTATKLYKGDKTVAGSWKDAVVGGKVTGSYFKTSEGKLLAVSVYFK